MVNFKIEDKEYKLAEDWKEVNLKQWCDFIRYVAQIQKDNEVATEIFGGSIEELEQSFYSVLTFSNAPEEELGRLTEHEIFLLAASLNFLIQPITDYTANHFYIDDVLYVGPTANDVLTVKEKMTFAKIQKQLPEKADHIPYLMAILIRPGKEVWNEEFKKKEYVRDQFVSETKVIQDRTDRFMRELTADKFNYLINFFMSSSQG